MAKQSKAKAGELQRQVAKLRSAHEQMVDLAGRAEKCAVELSHVLDGAEKELAKAQMESELP
jgi:hypothetical protein